MQYRTLGSTGMSVSVIGLGTWQFGGEWGKEFSEREVADIFAAARDEGVNLIDTAECYGDHTAESLIGQAIAGDRDRWVIATKFGHIYHGWMSRTDDYSVPTMLRQLEDSLRALRTDYIDVYQVHGVSQQTFQDEKLWEELERQKILGRIRAVGVSIRPDPALLGRPIIQAAQILYNRLDPRAEEAIFPGCLEKKIAVLARVPLASGLLTVKYKRGHTWPKTDVRSQLKPEEVDAKLREVERIEREEVPPGVPLATWALAWCLRHPAVSAVIPGCKSPEQLRANAAAADLIIS